MLAAPTIKVKTTTGMTINFNNRTKMSPKGVTHSMPEPKISPAREPAPSPMRIRISRLVLKYQRSSFILPP